MPFFKKRPSADRFLDNNDEENDIPLEAAARPDRPLSPLSLQSRIKRRPDIVFGEVADEAVLVSPDQARVRMLNEVGSRLWVLADGAVTLQELAGALVAEYEVAPDLAAADVLAFARELQEAGLVDVV